MPQHNSGIPYDEHSRRAIKEKAISVKEKIKHDGIGIGSGFTGAYTNVRMRAGSPVRACARGRVRTRRAGVQADYARRAVCELGRGRG